MKEYYFLVPDLSLASTICFANVINISSTKASFTFSSDRVPIPIIISVNVGIFYSMAYLNWPALQPGGGTPVGKVGEMVAVVSGRQLGVNDTSSMAISPW